MNTVTSWFIPTYSSRDNLCVGLKLFNLIEANNLNELLENHIYMYVLIYISRFNIATQTIHTRI